MSRTRGRGAKRKRVRFGAPDRSLTGSAGVLALDEQRQDVAAQLLSAVPAIPARTANSLARRFGPAQRAGIETGLAAVTERAVSLLPAARRDLLLGEAPTIDLDSTDVEVYGAGKDGVAYNYLGQRAGRPHLATWAQAGLSPAADLLAGNDDVRPRAAGLLHRALAALPEPVRPDPTRPHPRDWRPAVRADAGYFTAELARAAVAAGCDFAIAAKRNPAMWRAYAGIGELDWHQADRMPGAQVAVCDYAPAGWPPGSYTIVRRVRLDVTAIRRSAPGGRTASQRHRTPASADD